MLTSEGCDKTSYELRTGPTDFTVKNDNAPKATEFEVVQGGSIKGEVENLTPGLTRKFSLNLVAGEFDLLCGSTSGPKAKLTVTGAATQQNAAATAAADDYRRYVEAQSDELVTSTTKFTAAVIAGHLNEAKSLYASSRAPYERIEPVAESFGDLDAAIDGRADDETPIDKLQGYHRLEHALWQGGSTDGMAPIAQKLLTDVTALRDKVRTVPLDVAQIANGATELLGEVSKSKVTGEEERYSRTDLSDFKGNVDGSQRAIAAVRPLISSTEPALLSTIDQRFSALDGALAAYQHDGTWVSYDTLTKEQVRALSQLVDAVAEPVSQVAAKVAAASK